MNKGKINKIRRSVTPSLNSSNIIEMCSKQHTDGQENSIIFQQKYQKALKLCQ